jgi:methylation protein EvaC
MVQLLEQPTPEQMFHDAYAFFSSTSTRMAAHFEELALHTMRDHLRGNDPFVVEIGSNDGILLRHFARKGLRHLGVEPSMNVAEAASANGVRTRCAFFNNELAESIAGDDGRADVVLAANVMCHVADINSVISGIHCLLKPAGLLIFEDPYLGDIVRMTSYDQIYDEHAYYFSVTSVSNLLSLHGMSVVDIAPQAVHGGSMRYIESNSRGMGPSERVTRRLAQEQEMGLGDVTTFHRLRDRIERSRSELMAVLNRLRTEGRRVVGYGATSKSTTVTNYCGITPEHIEFISDTTPIKQGKFSPGAHIPVRSHTNFQESYPDYALLFAWNHADEIMANEGAFRDAGGQWVTYVPDVRII